MNVEESLVERARLHAALGDPARLAIAEALALGDLSPRELSEALGLASNLLAHHVGVLASAGLVGRNRSEADRRRAYLRLLPAAYPFVRTPHQTVTRVVFACTQNSARSQLAAALLAQRCDLPTASGGTRPAAGVHPRAVAIARRHGIELHGARTAHIDTVARPDDLVVVVCDNAYEELSRRQPVALHWSVPDPAVPDTSDAFAATFETLADRVGRLVTSINEEPTP